MKNKQFFSATLIMAVGIGLVSLRASAQAPDSAKAAPDNSLPPASQMQTGTEQTIHNGQAPEKGNYKMPNTQRDTSGNSKMNSGSSNAGTSPASKPPKKKATPVPMNSKPAPPINRDSIPPHK